VTSSKHFSRCSSVFASFEKNGDEVIGPAVDIPIELPGGWLASRFNFQLLAPGCESRTFFKQWGGVQKKKAGRLLDGRTYDGMPSRPVVSCPPRDERLALVREVEGWPTRDAAQGVA
jgi:hypothetical protein